MYLTIKAYSEEIFKKFHTLIAGKGNVKSQTSIIFDFVDFEGVEIIFYKNLTIYFKGKLTEELIKRMEILLDKNLYIGSDEVGIGETIGPLVVCSYKFKNIDSKKKALFLGLKDSKDLTYSQVVELFGKIKDLGTSSCKIMTPKKFSVENKKIQNVKKMNAMLHNESHKSIKDDKSIHVVDAFCEMKHWDSYLKGTNKFEGKLILETKAESKYMEVAAAAIIAKYSYDKWVLDYLKEKKISYPVVKKLDSNKILKMIDEGHIKLKDKFELVKDWKKD